MENLFLYSLLRSHKPLDQIRVVIQAKMSD